MRPSNVPELYSHNKHIVIGLALRYGNNINERFMSIYGLFRYLVLASSAMMAAPDAKTAASICFETINLEEDRYRLGHTKLFFRTGVVAYLEELREEKIQFMMRSVQVSLMNHVALMSSERSF